MGSPRHYASPATVTETAARHELAIMLVDQLDQRIHDAAGTAGEVLPC
jgi:hypothetical protein